MRTKLYLDTSILGALVDRGPEDRLVATRRLLQEVAADAWEAFISTLVLSEVDRAAAPIRRRIPEELTRIPVVVFQETAESIGLARAYLAADAIPRTAEGDARHIALATVSDIRVVVSWNVRHMVNIERKRRVNSVNLRRGCQLLDIVSPWEVRSDEA
jgi:predicted nucleic acid-binding protein